MPQNLKNRVFLSLKIPKISWGENPPDPPSAYATASRPKRQVFNIVQNLFNKKIAEGTSERSQKRVVCAAICASIVIQEYGDRNWLALPQSASDARAAVHFDRNWPISTHTFCHSAIFHPNTPCDVWFFWVSRHYVSHFSKKKNGNIFGQILRNSRKCVKTWMIENSNWSQNALVFFFAKQSLESLPEVVLTGEPNTNKKKQPLSTFSPLKRKEGYFFVWGPFLTPL